MGNLNATVTSFLKPETKLQRLEALVLLMDYKISHTAIIDYFESNPIYEQTAYSGVFGTIFNKNNLVQAIPTVNRYLTEINSNKKMNQNISDKDGNHSPMIKVTSHSSTESKEDDKKAMAIYQNEVYGNSSLLLSLTSPKMAVDHQRRSTFNRYKRLSMIASQIPQNLLKSDDENDNDDDDEDNMNIGNINNEKKEKAKSLRLEHKSTLLDIKEDDLLSPVGNDAKQMYDDENVFDVEHGLFGDGSERLILEELMSNDLDNGKCNEFLLRLFYPIKNYLEYEPFDNEKKVGMKIKTVFKENKFGKELIMEFGIIGNDKWIIQMIEDTDVTNLTLDEINKILDDIQPEFGFDVKFKCIEEK